jgi:hypothetical protein
MYFPSYEQMLQVSGQSRAAVEAANEVRIPLDLFRLLMQAALKSADFDPEAYLAANPDINEAVRRGSELSPAQHFVAFGYFEGRRGALPKVDEAWYLRTYPDVAAAVKAGKVKSATEHFEIIGAGEGRAPSQALSDEAKQWKYLMLGR